MLSGCTGVSGRLTEITLSYGDCLSCTTSRRLFQLTSCLYFQNGECQLHLLR